MLSERIYTLRRKSGLSQEQLAEKIGVSRQAVSKWESGTSTPELEKLIALSGCFHITVDELITGTASSVEAEDAPADDTTAQHRAESKLGIGLCLFGAICLLLTGLIMILHPAAMQKINASSAVTLNGFGILLLFCVLAMVVGMILILRKK